MQTKGHTLVGNVACSLLRLKIFIITREHTRARRGLLARYAALNSSVHTGAKPHACDKCEKKFSRSYLLKCHLKGHVCERPYGCERCGRKYAHTSSLKRHVKCHDDARETFEKVLKKKNFYFSFWKTYAKVLKFQLKWSKADYFDFNWLITQS